MTINSAKAMKIFFTVSVLLNIALIGVFAGSALKRMGDDPLRSVHAEMSPEARHIVAREMQSAFRDNRAEMQKAREVKKAVRDILSAEEFDAEAFEAKAMEMHDTRTKMGLRRIEVTKELASKLSQEDRKVLATRFSSGFRGAKNRNGKQRSRESYTFLKEHEAKGESEPKAPRGASEPGAPAAESNE
ncbi:MAG: periplasmic heavy metal sensor [Alphaproteobacteria bacterium]